MNAWTSELFIDKIEKIDAGFEIRTNANNNVVILIISFMYFLLRKTTTSTGERIERIVAFKDFILIFRHIFVEIEPYGTPSFYLLQKSDFSSFNV